MTIYETILDFSDKLEKALIADNVTVKKAKEKVVEYMESMLSNAHDKTSVTMINALTDVKELYKEK